MVPPSPRPAHYLVSLHHLSLLCHACFYRTYPGARSSAEGLAHTDLFDVHSRLCGDAVTLALVMRELEKRSHTGRSGPPLRRWSQGPAPAASPCLWMPNHLRADCLDPAGHVSGPLCALAPQQGGSIQCLSLSWLLPFSHHSVFLNKSVIILPFLLE